jgi:hypothetical protein
MPEPRPMNMAELLSDIEREWKALMGVVGRLTPAQMNTPDSGGWSPKDNLAHLAEWINVLMGYHMDQRPPHEVLGVAPEVTADWDMDVINPVLFERNRKRPADEVQNQLRRVYAELIAKLRAMPFDELMKPRRADDPEHRPLLDSVFANTTEHFAEHRATIEKIL